MVAPGSGDRRSAMSVDLDADATGTAAVLARVLVDQRDVAQALDVAHRAAWAAVEPRLLELCRLRAAQLIGCGAEAGAVTPGAGVSLETADQIAQWPTVDTFDERDRAVLAWCEQFVIDVASMTDDQVDAVRTWLGDDGVVNLTNALLVIEQRQRLRTMWERLQLSEEALS